MASQKHEVWTTLTHKSLLVHEKKKKKWIFVAPLVIPSEIGIKLKLKV